jgi:hypothetical protein
MLAYYGSDPGWKEAGYDGPWLGRVDVPVLSAPNIETEPLHEKSGILSPVRPLQKPGVTSGAPWSCFMMKQRGKSPSDWTDGRSQTIGRMK